MANYSLINITNLAEKIKGQDNDWILIEDNDNSKKISLQNLILSIIKDNELPGESRIFSSKKIDDMYQDLLNNVQITVTGMEGDVKELKEMKVGQDIFNAIIEDLERRKIETRNLEPIINSLEGKRDNTTPIKSNELDTSDDEYKIKLENLSREVLDAIVGDAPVAIPQVPEGGWVSRHIANRAIISTKLADTYRYKGLITDMSVSNITADGIYLLGPDVKDLPKYLSTDRNLMLLEVTRFGESGSYIKQEIEYYDNSDTRPRYVRKGPVGRIQSVEFTEIWDINDNYKIDSHLLSENYSDRGIITSDINIFDMENTGTYYVMAGATGVPDNTVPYTLDISRCENTIIYTLRNTTNDYCLLYIAQKFLTSSGIPTVTPWHSINKLNKSKFDGKKLLIFGDGISYGIGASRLSTTSYAALLKLEYGFTVQNHAIGDATAGNYEDLICENSSVLTQIKNATINDTCDYCILFVGTNDWRGARQLGKISDFNDTSFYGSMNTAIVSLLEKSPKMKIILVTPMFRSRQNFGDDKNSDDYTVDYVYLSEFANAIIELGKKYHLPVVDLYSTLCINKYNSMSYLDDGLHPNDDGHKLVCDHIFNAMNIYF